jgi:peptidyl-prolyl cis-trans isomerase SurA
MNKSLVASAIALTLSGVAAAQGLQLRSTSAPSIGAPSISATAPGSDDVAAQHDSDGIAAVVGNEVITDYDLDLRARATASQLAAQGVTPAPQVLRQQVLDTMIDQMALAQYAQANGIEVSDTTLQQALKQTAANFKLDVGQLRHQVEAQGLSWSEYQAQLRREILIARLRQRDVASRVTVSDQEIDHFLAQQRSQQQAPQGDITLAQIFVPLAANADAAQVAAARSRIDAALALLRQGRDFAQVAKLDSTGAEARDGGLLGTRTAQDWPDTFIDAIRGLHAGQVTGVIRSPAGFHILKLVAEPSSTATTTAENSAMQAQVREIVLDIGSRRSRDAAVKELDAVRDAVLQGKIDFATKAREISQDIESARRGGDIGWVLPGELPPALDSALDRLNPGQLSAPVALPDKVVLLQLVDRREHPLDARQERAVARNILLQQKERKEFADFVQDVRARTYVRLSGSDS